jgi:hypothetical protein
MHHNRKRSTSRKELKRIGNKQARAAEAQALNGGTSRLVRGRHWQAHVQPPLIDGVTGSPKPKKEKKQPRYICPAREGNKHHAYLRDVEQVTDYHWGWDPERGDWCRKEPYTYDRKYKLCVYCGKEQSVGRRRYRW